MTKFPRVNTLTQQLSWHTHYTAWILSLNPLSRSVGGDRQYAAAAAVVVVVVVVVVLVGVAVEVGWVLATAMAQRFLSASQQRTPGEEKSIS